ncbi:hypothetical protein [Myroides odoratus]|uniref:hypothetical protein n=1 Tax=Myroides odoratus TaxID=256 RepID=UPI0039AFE984
MKKIAFIPIVILFAIGCSSDNESSVYSKKDTSENFQLQNGLRSLGNFDWENETEITLPGGNKRTLPWISGANTAIPNYITDDYQRDKGWELIYNLTENVNDLGNNYLIFYNKFTGILRVFYYLNETVTLGNNGYWGLKVTGNNALLNNSNYFAYPINHKINNPLYVSSNIVNESLLGNNKLITRGWNVFETEFTYTDESIENVKMSISSYNENISNVMLEGNVDLNSEGTIITASTTNPFQTAANNVAKGAGNAATKYIKDNITNGVIKMGAGVIGGGVTAIVSKGINLIFGSFIGKKERTSTTTQKIEFKTHGKVTMNGSITSSNGNNILPVANLPIPTGNTISNSGIRPLYNHPLGVWNLEESPKINLSVYAFGDESLNGDLVDFSRTVSLDQSSIKVKINPTVLSEIERYEVKTNVFVYKKFQNENNWNNNATTAGFHDHLSFNGTLVYKDAQNEIYSNVGAETYKGVGGPPVSTGQGPFKTPIRHLKKGIYDNRYVVKVEVTLYPKGSYDQDPIVISRSYLPTFGDVGKVFF